MSFEFAPSRNQPMLMDGAMGTELALRGMDLAECGAVWNLTHPKDVRGVHRTYVEAGAEVLLTNTFSANPISLAKAGYEDRLDEICEAGVRLAREAGGRTTRILASVGPMLDGFPSKSKYRDFADRRMLAEVVTSLVEADAILLETCSSAETLADVEYLLHRVPMLDKPIFLSLTYLFDPVEGLTTFSGHRPETFSRHAEKHGVAALGVNCGRAIDAPRALEIARRYHEYTDLPLFVRPNAGTPVAKGSEWIYPHAPEATLSILGELMELGVQMVGGCCGTTPAHIRTLRDALAQSGSSSQS